MKKQKLILWNIPECSCKIEEIAVCSPTNWKASVVITAPHPTSLFSMWCCMGREIIFFMVWIKQTICNALHLALSIKMDQKIFCIPL